MNMITERMQDLAGININEVYIDIKHGWGSLTGEMSDQEAASMLNVVNQVIKKYENYGFKVNDASHKTGEGHIGVDISHKGRIAIRVRRLNDTAAEKHKGRFLVHLEDIWDIEREEHQKAYVVNNLALIKGRVEAAIKFYIQHEGAKEKKKEGDENREEKAEIQKDAAEKIRVLDKEKNKKPVKQKKPKEKKEE